MAEQESGYLNGVHPVYSDIVGNAKFLVRSNDNDKLPPYILQHKYTQKHYKNCINQTVISFVSYPLHL